METFAKLFERFLFFVYHCFDRIVIQGYLPLLSRSEHIVYFFRDVHGIYPITPQALAKRTPEYRGWVEGYARNHKVPIMSPEKDESNEEFVRPHLQRMERQNRHGVYFIILSMEMGRTFCSLPPKYPTDDPDYRIIRSRRSRHLHYYFYIRDPVLGPLAMCVSTYLPFQSTYYLNGHHFIEIELRRQGVTFRKDDNAFLSTTDPKALQATADKLSSATIEKRLNPLELAAMSQVFREGPQSCRLAPRLLHQRSSSSPARWACSAWPPIRWPTSSGEAFRRRCGAHRADRASIGYRGDPV
jgi:hypothetical protein